MSESPSKNSIAFQRSIHSAHRRSIIGKMFGRESKSGRAPPFCPCAYPSPNGRSRSQRNPEHHPALRFLSPKSRAIQKLSAGLIDHYNGKFLAPSKSSNSFPALATDGFHRHVHAFHGGRMSCRHAHLSLCQKMEAQSEQKQRRG